MTDLKVDDLNVLSEETLITPNQLKVAVPASEHALATVSNARLAMKRILRREDPRLFLIVGPCSIHDIDAAMEYGACIGGCTVHHVSEVLDGGKPTVQVAIPLSPNSRIDEVMELEFRAGCLALLQSIWNLTRLKDQDWSAKSLFIKATMVLMNPCQELPEKIHNEDFWQSLKF